MAANMIVLPGVWRYVRCCHPFAVYLLNQVAPRAFPWQDHLGSDPSSGLACCAKSLMCILMEGSLVIFNECIFVFGMHFVPKAFMLSALRPHIV